MTIKTRMLTLFTSAATALLLQACASNHSSQPPAARDSATQEAATQDINTRAQALFETFFSEDLARSPVEQTFLGIKTDYGKWDDISAAFEAETFQLKQDQLQRLTRLDSAAMDGETRLSYRLQKQKLEQEIADYRWRDHNYPVNQMFGWHTLVPSLLINQHSIDSEEDASAYISRLNGVPQLFDQLIEGLAIRADKGVIPPKFVFPHTITASRNIISGRPFADKDAASDSALFADFKRKVGALEVSAEKQEALLQTAEKALRESVQPAYEKLIAYLQQLEQRADTRDGAWKFPEGEAFYNAALARTTTTNLTAGEVHNIGLSEVARIHGEMRDIMAKVNFKGDLQAFFEFMRTDKRFYYEESEAGKQAYLDKATAIIDNMRKRLDELFITKPKADIKVQRVEAFREKSAGKAFYQNPPIDGSRPGLFYANLYRMSSMPIYQLEALAYHEGIPGHHMQIAIAQELEGVPQFRKYGRYTAYVEGWGLYSELVPKEMGLYEDPYSDFGRLAMELWRACRLVVDTGLHAKRWSREKAIEYLKVNTPNPEGDIDKAIERYIVMPSQATAYKIGMLKILELRGHAQEALGEKFNIRHFHDVVLRNGPLPLDILEQVVDEWTAEVKAGKASQ